MTSYRKINTASEKTNKLQSYFPKYRSSRSEVFCSKGALRNFGNFAGKHLCQSLFFNKVAGLRPATLLKKRLWHKRFPVNFSKFLRTTFFNRKPSVAASASNRCCQVRILAGERPRISVIMCCFLFLKTRSCQYFFT